MICQKVQEHQQQQPPEKPTLFALRAVNDDAQKEIAVQHQH